MTCRTESGVTYLQTYSAENRIASIAKLVSGTCAAPGNYAAKWDFTYDGDGVRTAQSYTPYTNGQPGTVVITRYYFGGAYETTGSTWKKYYSFAGQTIAMRDSTASGFKYFLTDHLGSVSVVLDANGGILEQQRYLPFGQARVMPPYASVTSTDFTYTGQRNLADIGLMDYKARFYSPYINRFLQPDGIIPDLADPQSLNRFSYTLNNPINHNDPTGHCIDGVTTLVCVVVAGQVAVDIVTVVIGVVLIANSISESQELVEEMGTGKNTRSGVGNSRIPNSALSAYNAVQMPSSQGSPQDPKKKPDTSGLSGAAKAIRNLAEWAKDNPLKILLVTLIAAGATLTSNAAGDPSPIKNAFIQPTPVNSPTQIATPTLILTPTQVLTGTTLPTRTRTPTPTYTPTNTPTSTPTYIPGIPTRRFRGYLDPE